MGDVIGWTAIAIILAVPVVFIGVGFSTRRQQRLDGSAAPSSGGLLGFDELFHPSAHDARVQWEAQQEIPDPAPTPDRGPGVIEGGRRITIDVSDASSARGGAGSR